MATEWILILFLLSADRGQAVPIAVFPTEAKCEQARTLVNLEHYDVPDNTAATVLCLRKPIDVKGQS
jgi:hypothetical protein